MQNALNLVNKNAFKVWIANYSFCPISLLGMSTLWCIWKMVHLIYLVRCYNACYNKYFMNVSCEMCYFSPDLGILGYKWNLCFLISDHFQNVFLRSLALWKTILVYDSTIDIFFYKVTRLTYMVVQTWQWHYVY